MSDRERWIVYPLLLLALGTSLRMKMVGTEQLRVHRELDAELIRCREFVVHNDQGQVMFALSAGEDGKFSVVEARRGVFNATELLKAGNEERKAESGKPKVESKKDD